MNEFDNILAMAQKRKGGEEALNKLLPSPISKDTLAKKSDDRFLSTMTRCIFQAGFNWSVINKKWPTFEEAFHGFNPAKLSSLSFEDWDAYLQDTRIVRNGPKIKALRENVNFVINVQKEHGSFAKFIANWPEDDIIGLLDYLKKHGSRLGGNTGQYFLRFVGKDSFILSRDVTTALRHIDLDIRDQPTSKRELKLAQDIFNQWHKQTGTSYANLSRILAYSIGENYANEYIQEQQAKYA